MPHARGTSEFRVRWVFSCSSCDCKVNVNECRLVQQTVSNNMRRSVHFASVSTIFIEPDVFFIMLHVFWPHDAMHAMPVLCMLWPAVGLSVRLPDRERKCADTTGTVPVPLAYPFQCKKILIYFSNRIYGSNFIKHHSETVMV